MGLRDFLIYLALLSPVIPLFLFNKDVRNQNWGKVVLSILTLNLLFDLITLLSYYQSFDNYVLFVLYSIASCFLVITLYSYHLLRKGYRKKLYTAFFVYCIISISVFFTNEINVVYSILYLFMSALAILLACLYFFNELIILEHPNIVQSSFFWINSGLLIYFGTTFFLSLVETFLPKSMDNIILTLWPIQNLSAILFNVLIAIGIWKARRV